MITPVFLSADEKELLHGWHRDGVSALIRDRAHCLLMHAEAETARWISVLLRRDYKTIREWIRAFQEKRIASLFDHYQGNTNASKLTRAQRDQIKQVLATSPSDQGIPKEFWTIRGLKKFLSATFGVVYESDRSYHFLFQLGRLSWKLPETFDVKRNDKLVTTRIEEIRAEIAPYLKNSQWVVLAADETRIVWESETRRAWLKTNEKTVLKVHRDDQYQSYFGALNLTRQKCHLHRLSWQNQEEIIKALEKLVAYYPTKKICLIWDNARWHKGKLLREKLKKGQSLERLHLINFPPYAPDTNPQEHIWKYAKDRTANITHPSFEKTLNTFQLAVIHRKFPYHI